MTGTCGDNLTWQLNSGKLTTIAAGAFMGCAGLTTITISDSVEEIGDYAFDGCWRLTSLTIPNSVEEIGFGAFSMCINLRTIYYPAWSGFEEILSAGNDAELIAY